MAKTKEKEVQNKVEGAKESEGNKKKSGILFTLLALLTALVVIALVFGGAAFIIVHNNINGIAEKNRNTIEGIPLLKYALPPLPNEKKEEDITKYSLEELRDKYKKLKDDKIKGDTEIESVNKEVYTLRETTRDQSKKVETLSLENQKLKADAKVQTEKIEDEKKKLADVEKKINQLIATGDKKGFKEYFEKVDSETAKKVYEDILKEQKASEEAKKFAKVYETMDPKAGAKIFQELGTAKMDLVVEILSNMSKDVSAEILASMDAKFAASVTDSLSKKYLENKNKK